MLHIHMIGLNIDLPRGPCPLLKMTFGLSGLHFKLNCILSPGCTPTLTERVLSDPIRWWIVVKSDSESQKVCFLARDRALHQKEGQKQDKIKFCRDCKKLQNCRNVFHQLLVFPKMQGSSLGTAIISQKHTWIWRFWMQISICWIYIFMIWNPMYHFLLSILASLMQKLIQFLGNSIFIKHQLQFPWNRSLH